MEGRNRRSPCGVRPSARCALPPDPSPPSPNDAPARCPSGSSGTSSTCARRDGLLAGPASSSLATCGWACVVHGVLESRDGLLADMSLSLLATHDWVGVVRSVLDAATIGFSCSSSLRARFRGRWPGAAVSGPRFCAERPREMVRWARANIVVGRTVHGRVNESVSTVVEDLIPHQSHRQALAKPPLQTVKTRRRLHESRGVHDALMEARAWTRMSPAYLTMLSR